MRYRLPVEITLVTYSREAETKVLRGENAGRTIKEYAIVRSVHLLGQANGESKIVSVDLSSMPESATMGAVLVQGVGQGPIIGAATTALR